MIVFPGVISQTKESFVSRLEEIQNIGDGVHVDFADGLYVPNTLLALSEIGKLPKDRFFEAHLMVNNPSSYFELCKQVGFKRVLVHFDSLVLDTYAEVLLVQDIVHKLGMEFCLVFTQQDPVELHEDLCKFDQVMIMPIIPGFSGQKFIPEQVEEVKKVRTFCPDLPIEIDGHVDETTIASLRAAGATQVVSTSYLSGSDLSIRYKKLKGE